MRSCANGETTFLWWWGDSRSSNTQIIAPKGFGCRHGNGISPGSRGWPHARDSRRRRETFRKESEESCAGLPHKISAGCCLRAAEGVKCTNPLRIGPFSNAQRGVGDGRFGTRCGIGKRGPVRLRLGAPIATGVVAILARWSAPCTGLASAQSTCWDRSARKPDS